MSNLFRSVALVLCVLTASTTVTQLPPPPQGGSYAVYENITRGNRFFVGFDTATGMVLFQRPVHGPAWYSSNQQDVVSFNPGESAIHGNVDPSRAKELFSLTEYFPALVSHILAHADPKELDTQDLNNGGWEIRTSTAFGSLWAYHKDPDDPRLQDVRPASFVFDADGILRRVRIGQPGNETETEIEYHQGVEHPRLAPKLVHPEHWRIIAAKTWVGDVPDEIADLDSVLAFAKMHAFAEAEAFQQRLDASLASDEGMREAERTSRRMLEPLNGSSPKRWALPIVFVGGVFLGIGGIAWWKQR